MLSLLVNGTDGFTGDTLFKGSVGGVRAPGHTTYSDLRSSIMDKLLKLPPHTRIHPGHTDPSTVAEELEHNAFVRIWRIRRVSFALWSSRLSFGIGITESEGSWPGARDPK